MQPAIVVTGASRGLGLATAQILVDRGERVVLACRSTADSERTRAEIVARSADAADRVEVAALDVGDLDSVRRFATAFTQPMRALVCNAGTQLLAGVRRTAGGLEQTFATNHLGHFLLARLLAPAIEPRGRIVFVASNTHDPKRHTGMPAPQLDDLDGVARGEAFADEPEAIAGRRRYTTSKLCNVLTAYELDRRLHASPLADRELGVFAFDPGLMPGTGLAREYSAIARWAWRYVMPVLTALVPNVNRVATSARRLASLAVGELASASGTYVSRGRVTRSSAQSYDAALAARLWTTSSKLAGVAVEQAA